MTRSLLMNQTNSKRPMTKSVTQILTEHFKRLGSKGGKVKSQAKRDAARANGSKGGRKPKKAGESKND